MRYLDIRRADLFKNAKADEVDAYVVFGASNLAYLTGYDGVPGALALTSKRAVFVCDDPDDVPPADEDAGVEVVSRLPEPTLAQAVGVVLAKLGAKNVGFDADSTPVGDVERMAAAAPKSALKPVRGRMAGLRMIKDPAEVEQVRAAVRVGDRAFTMFRVLLHEGDTEKEMSDALEGYVRRAGARAAAFPTSVLVGERGAIPNARPTERKVSDGSKLVASWGADVGYKCVAVRTLKSPFAVTPTRRTKSERLGFDFDKVAAAVLAAHKAAVQAILPEATAGEVYAAARQKIVEAGYGDHFPNRIGHGIGVDLVEAPTLSAASTEVLRSGMVLALTTGLSLPEWGTVRIGDTVLVVRDGANVLSVLPQDPAAYE